MAFFFFFNLVNGGLEILVLMPLHFPLTLLRSASPAGYVWDLPVFRSLHCYSSRADTLCPRYEVTFLSNKLFLHTRQCRKEEKKNHIRVWFKFYVTSRCFSVLRQNQNKQTRTCWWHSVKSLSCCRPADWGGGGLWWRRDTHLPSVRGLQPASPDQAPGHRWQRHHTLPHQGTHALTLLLTDNGDTHRLANKLNLHIFTFAHLNVTLILQ